MNIKAMREKAGKSQLEIAVALGVNQSAVANWETGVALPRAEKIKKLAALLDCSIDELFEVKEA